MQCAECGVQSADVTQLCVQCGAPVAGQRSVPAEPATATVRASLPGTAAGPAGQTAPEPYVPGRGDKVPAPIRRTRRGYSYLGWGAVFGGWALITAGGYFFNLYSTYDFRYLYAGLALW